MITEILLFLILVVLIIHAYLLYKLLPTEKQKEVLRKVVKAEGEVIEWQPPKTEVEEAFNKVLREIKK
jgi:uncharacterized membrane protein